MSAICGIYNKTAAADGKEAEAVMAELGKYRFDKNGSYLEGPVFLGCRLNCVTPESLDETLPYEDQEASLIITADAIIDNRDELFGLLAIPGESRNCPDSFLILEAYKKWGTACPEKLAGDFAFAIWDKRKGELFCARDHTGGRSFYYYNSKDAFVFATVMEPLFRTGRIKKRLNETYIADFLAASTFCEAIDDDVITPYEEIFPLPPASAMLVGATGIKQWRYWEIKKTREIRFATDAEYEAAFRKIYSEAVRCRLRSVKKVGILLSGGLDSGSVACLAAPELKKRGEKLISFTQVPMEGYRDWLPDNNLADEREYVEAICAFTGNIEPHYLAFAGRNPLNVIDERIKAYGQPSNLVGNSHWVDAIPMEAARMGVGVLLGGKTGNGTVSWGKFYPYMKYLLKSWRFKTFLRETGIYAERKDLNQTKLILNVLLNSMPYGVKFLAHKIRGGKDFTDSWSAINPEFFKAMGVKRRFKKLGFNYYCIDRGDPLRLRLRMLGFSRFSRSGALATQQSLLFGIAKRDPTRDKRLIDFCINLPENQWVRGGEERRLIRHAMKGRMPEKVRLNTVRGHQAADLMQRIAPEWAEAYKEMGTIGAGELERKYLDISKLKRLLAENRELSADDHDGKSSGVQLLIRALIFTRFLRSLDLDG